MDVMPDKTTPFGERVRRRLTEEQVIWLTTVGHDLTPQPNPVWFLWDGGSSLLIYNRATARRLVNMGQRPRVSLHFDSDGHGRDIVVLAGAAEFLAGAPPVTEFPDYLTKYDTGIHRISDGVDAFAKAYPVPVRIHLTRVRGY
jgi:PPOX class probable F420-dependent enzyme